MSAIALVTGVNASSILNGGDMTITFATAPIANDLVVIAGGHFAAAGATVGPTTGGYTQLANFSTNAQHFGAWQKVMGSSPDTTVTVKGSGSTADSVGYAYVILRGTDTATPIDVTTTISTASSTNPDPPSITPTNDGCWILAFSGSQVNDANPGTISGYSNTGSASSNDTHPMSIAGATLLQTKAAAENPGPWSAWSTGAWGSVTIAVRQSRLPNYVPYLQLQPILAQ